MQNDPPVFPVGDFVSLADVDNDMRRAWIVDLAQLPSQLRQAVAGLSESQLDTKYRHWTIRQIVHHIADSHVNSYIRFKWTLTESTPTIKAYDENLWSDLPESRIGSITPSLQLLDGLHARWCQLLETLPPASYERAFVHPATRATVTLNSALAYYAWHGRHHTGQILWLRDARRV
ncbi:MAG: putative metal-dependent hydrolase [Pirellulaceae bacterium]|nr:putative metal-dependent hydrolase [Pirellulaceae bacterium]